MEDTVGTRVSAFAVRWFFVPVYLVAGATLYAAFSASPAIGWFAVIAAILVVLGCIVFATRKGEGILYVAQISSLCLALPAYIATLIAAAVVTLILVICVMAILLLLGAILSAIS
ncbi:MAG: hypothetical protein WD926_01690 [Patescibacteria group bacterium]